MRHRNLAAIPALTLAILGTVGCDQLPARSANRGTTPVPAEDEISSESETSTEPELQISFDSSSGVTEEKSLEVIRRRAAAESSAASERTERVQLAYDRTNQTASAPALGLMWTLEAAGLYEHVDAQTHCSDLDFAGHVDWRLPTIDEGRELLNSGYTPSTHAGIRYVWSSTPHPSRGMLAYDLVERRSAQLASGFAHVVCVRDHDAASNIHP